MTEFTIVVDATHGYRRVDPPPTPTALADFYGSRYYGLLNEGSRAPDLARLRSGGQDAAREREWLHGVHYEDIYSIIATHLRGNRALDVGCGTGDFVAFLVNKGLEAHGIEPSVDAVESARAEGLVVSAETIESVGEAVERGDAEPFDLVSLLCVLEHVSDPRQTLAAATQALAPDGLLCVKVPNDFSVCQRAAQQVNCAPDWWVVVPDHVNYFSAASLSALIGGAGLEVLNLSADFPMELFILLGMDYITDPLLGPSCHERRRSMELSMNADTRRSLYTQFAQAGLGRNLIVTARVASS